MENALTRIARWIAECPPHTHSLATQRASAAVQDTVAPRTEAEARFSMHYCLACALLGGAVTESDFAATAIMRPEVRALLPRIVLLGYPADPKGTDSSPDEPDHVRVLLKDGQRFEISVGHVPGGPGSPLSEQQLHAKLHQCAMPVIGEENARDLKAALDGFSVLPDVRAVTCHLLAAKVSDGLQAIR